MLRSFVWKSRLVFIDIDGTLIMSEVGASRGLDFSKSRGIKSDPWAAVAFKLNGPMDPKTGEPTFADCVDAAILDEDRIVITGSDGSVWVLSGDPNQGGRLDRYEPAPVKK